MRGEVADADLERLAEALAALLASWWRRRQSEDEKAVVDKTAAEQDIEHASAVDDVGPSGADFIRLASSRWRAPQSRELAAVARGQGDGEPKRARTQRTPASQSLQAGDDRGQRKEPSDGLSHTGA